MTELVKLPSGRLVRGTVIERTHGYGLIVNWAGMVVTGKPLMSHEIEMIEAATAMRNEE